MLDSRCPARCRLADYWPTCIPTLQTAACHGERESFFRPSGKTKGPPRERCLRATRCVLPALHCLGLGGPGALRSRSEHDCPPGADLGRPPATASNKTTDL